MKKRIVFIVLTGWALSLAACFGQTAECQKYLECAESLSPGSKEALTPEYGPDGTCWKLTAQAAAACSEACSKALSDAGDQVGAPSTCIK
jgi:hypothetical protein